MRNCFILNCDYVCKTWPKPRMMFLPPKDEELFLVWKSRVPEIKRQFRKTDKICERHFNSDDIITTWDHNINGAVHKLERHKPKLKPTAIPELNLYIDPRPRKHKKNDSRPAPAKKSPKENNKLQIERLYKVRNDVNKAGSLVADEINIEIIPEIENQRTIIQSEIEVEIVEGIDEDILEKFESLYDDIYEVVLPNTLWGLHRDPERKFIVFSLFDVQAMVPSKIYMITNQFKTKTIIRNKLSTEDRITQIDFEDISANLDAINQIQLCSGSHTNENCLIILEDGLQICSSCQGKIIS